VLLLETVGIAPKGSMGVSGFLKKGADGLVAGGKKGIYTVMYFTAAKKPVK
jgi:sterol 24-C-methyltransferase